VSRYAKAVVAAGGRAPTALLIAAGVFRVPNGPLVERRAGT